MPLVPLVVLDQGEGWGQLLQLCCRRCGQDQAAGECYLPSAAGLLVPQPLIAGTLGMRAHAM